ncbi:glycosyltransferase family 4 protein [Paenibacillus lentus]|uniref:glycosyltransferase family 4 protein n=1 Tax=Paenibacillus lentus TaxID=1338368 RepID=UPI0036689E05
MLKIKSVLYQITYKIAVVFKPLIVRLLPQELRQKAKKVLLRKAFPIEKTYRNQPKTNLSKGVNLIGYSRAEMGIGESCRIAARNLYVAEIPFGILNFIGTNAARMLDLTWSHKEVENPLHSVNLFHINAEQMTEVYAHYGNSLFQERYNIGYWHWELPDFPDEWIDNFNLVDEVWVPSTFVADSIALKSPVPVVKIPHSIKVDIEEPRNREYYYLPENAFLFLSMYDVKSYKERKNPRASIEAFKSAFAPDDLRVGLVLKVNSFKSGQAELELLDSLIEDYQNIYLIKHTISRNDINSLLSITDCFVSLHRSEGFGLGLAEAMYLGKPVIGTNWSSNIDFMDSGNSCLVDYTLISLGEDYGPYKGYQYWANPDIDNAARYMKRLVSDKDFYQSIALAGQKHILEHYSPEAVGKLIQKRLDYIYLWKFGG